MHCGIVQNVTDITSAGFEFEPPKDVPVQA